MTIHEQQARELAERCRTALKENLRHHGNSNPLREPSVDIMVRELNLVALLENAKFGIDSPTWPHVLAFAKRMEAKLAKNRHKGDREGWLKDHPWNLVERILDETVEVQRHFIETDMGIKYNDAEGLANECADVANFCMMVADCVTCDHTAITNAMKEDGK